MAGVDYLTEGIIYAGLSGTLVNDLTVFGWRLSTDSFIDEGVLQFYIGYRNDSLAAYVFLAIVPPALMRFQIEPMTFIFLSCIGDLSFITPPVAECFAAASMAGSSALATGFVMSWVV